MKNAYFDSQEGFGVQFKMNYPHVQSLGEKKNHASRLLSAEIGFPLMIFDTGSLGPFVVSARSLQIKLIKRL